MRHRKSADGSHLPNPVEELERACAMMAKGIKADRRGNPEVLNEQLLLLVRLATQLKALMPQILEWDRQQAAKANERSWR